MSRENAALSPPSLLLAPWRELRALREPWRRWRARRKLAELPRGDGSPVLVLPGMHVGDLSTAPLRRFLRGLGHDALGWRLGLHGADVTSTLPRALARLEELATERGAALALVGWSLGGVVARELARMRPDLVSRLVTLGAPVVGGARATAVSYPYRLRGWDLDAIAATIDEANRTPIRVPVTAIWSRRDGLVAWRACVDSLTPGATNVEVGSAHWGLGFDPDAWMAIARALALNPQ
jgi:pimeloyl-ACP methyl ester carboxylesterase